MRTVLALAAVLIVGPAVCDAEERANPWGPPVREARPLVNLSEAYAAEAANRDVVISMEVASLGGAKVLKFRFELTRADGRWQPAPEGFTANIYDYHWPKPPVISNIRVRGEAVGESLKWTKEGGLEGAVGWKLAKPLKELVHRAAVGTVPKRAWDLVPQEGTVRVTLPLEPEAKHPRPTGLPPWWMPTVFGFNYYGTFTYEAAGETFTGEAEMNLKPHPVAGKFVPWTAIKVAKAEGGLAFTAHLPARRVAAEAGGFAIHRFDEPIDAGGFDGLRLTVETDAPRTDASVAVGLKEGQGAWYFSPAACPLTKKVNAWVLPFDRLVRADFVLTRGSFDANAAFDAEAVQSLAVGAHNPFGVGDVRFTVTSIELVRWTENGYAAAHEAPVRIDLDATTAVSLNGVGRVPEGLMGVHVVGDVKPDDPKQTEAYFEAIHVRFGRPLQHTSFTPTRRVGVPNAKTLHHLGLEASSVICYTWGNLWGRAPWMGGGDILPGVEAWGKALGESAWTPGEDANPLRLVEFWNEPFMWGRHINAYDPKWTDSTQHGYIPAELGARKYAEAFRAAKKGARSVNEHVRLGGPSAPAFSSDAYSVFWDYVRPIIDRTAAELDFLTEHHYGGTPESYAASYEVVTAYCDTVHGRRIPIYNTETNDLVDTPTMGDEGLAAPWSPHADDLLRFRYNLRDIMTMITQCPDKARGRAVHALWSGTFRKVGERHCFEILSAVGGTMLAATSTDPDVAVLACRQDDRGTLLVFNDSVHPRTIVLHAGKADFSKAEGRRVVFDPEAGTRIVEEPAPKGKELRLGAYEAVRFTFPLAEPTRQRAISEHFAAIHLADVAPGETVAGKVHWRDAPASPRAALLRVVTSGAEPGEGFVRVGATTVALPASAPGDPVIHDVPLPVEDARGATHLEFECTDLNGYRVLMAAILLEE